MITHHASQRSEVGGRESDVGVQPLGCSSTLKRELQRSPTLTAHHSPLTLPTLTRRFAVAVLAIILSALTSAACADDGIVVRGSGSASGRPTQVEMSGTINADAELAADAIVKFRDAKKRALAAIEGLKNPDLSVVPGGLSVGSGMDANQQMMAMRGMAVPTTGQKVRLSETMKITLNHADKLAADELMDKLLKVMDVAKDAGFQIGSAAASNYYEAMIRARRRHRQQRDGQLQASRYGRAARQGLSSGDRRCADQGAEAGGAGRRKARPSDRRSRGGYRQRRF